MTVRRPHARASASVGNQRSIMQPLTAVPTSAATAGAVARGRTCACRAGSRSDRRRRRRGRPVARSPCARAGCTPTASTVRCADAAEGDRRLDRRSGAGSADSRRLGRAAARELRGAALAAAACRCDGSPRARRSRGGPARRGTLVGAPRSLRALSAVRACLGLERGERERRYGHRALATSRAVAARARRACSPTARLCAAARRSASRPRSASSSDCAPSSTASGSVSPAA